MTTDDEGTTVRRQPGESGPEQTSSPTDTRPGGGIRTRRWWPDLLGIGWVLAAAAAVMAPALFHGLSLGPTDFLSTHGLTHQGGVTVHNPKTSDQIALFIPWTQLAWTQVHQGHIPLWNPYSVLGMPLAFNWESAPFGLPALIGYLFPLRLAYTVGVLVTLAVAGTGVYVLGRVLKLSVAGCVMAAVVFELSGRFMSTLGWSLGSVMSWSGWIFALAILVVRGRHRARDMALLAVVVAFIIYAGYPEGVALLGAALVVFFLVLFGSRLSAFGGSGPIFRPLLNLVGATIAGLLLSAPLLLPGLQVVSMSSRSGKLGIATQTLGPRYLLNNLVVGFDGLPWHGSTYFGPHTAGSTLIYVGIIAVVLAILAVAIRWRRPEVLGFAGVAVVMTALVFLTPFGSLIDHLPGIGTLRLYDALGPLAFAVAVLAGFGIDVLTRHYDKRTVRLWAGGGFAGAAMLLLFVWAFGSGHLNTKDTGIRAQSFLWPAISTVIGLAVVGALTAVSRRPSPGSGPRLHAGRWAAIALLAGETAFLVVAGAPTFASSPTYLSPTPAVLALQRAVGTSIVGFGQACLPYESLGILPNVNVSFEVQEFGVYDPTVPYNYDLAWAAAGGKRSKATIAKGQTHGDTFCPGVKSTVKARRFGIAYVLEQKGSRGPRGSKFVSRVGGEDLYRIPGAATATLSPLTRSGKLPPLSAPGKSVAVTYPDPASWKLTTHSTKAGVLRLRLTDLPGWHASIDGQPLALTTFAGVMLQARIPPGQHTIELHYWPTTFTIGIVLAVLTAIGLVLFLILAGRRQKHVHAPRSDA